MSEFLAVTLFYTVGTIFNLWEYIYLDFGIIYVLCLCIGNMEACEKLSEMRPSSSLLSPPILFSIFGNIII